MTVAPRWRAFSCLFFRMEFLWVALAVLKISLQTRLALNLDICLPLPPECCNESHEPPLSGHHNPGFTKVLGSGSNVAWKALSQPSYLQSPLPFNFHLTLLCLDGVGLYLELMESRLDSNSWRCTCLCLPSAETKGITTLDKEPFEGISKFLKCPPYPRGSFTHHCLTRGRFHLAKALRSLSPPKNYAVRIECMYSNTHNRGTIPGKWDKAMNTLG